jgi:hypothetical protein
MAREWRRTPHPRSPSESCCLGNSETIFVCTRVRRYIQYEDRMVRSPCPKLPTSIHVPRSS